ncbi:hypothetical protein HanRHA438_Chr16g0785471 [Helianthus annuus]|nr:hypothetical protein HanRHA438_Chr16g0785471 [Helianthus annuus]
MILSNMNKSRPVIGRLNDEDCRDFFYSSRMIQLKIEILYVACTLYNNTELIPLPKFVGGLS